MSRIQLALNVSDLASSVEFYRTLFRTDPHKQRPGYANFEIADPPLKLVLIETDTESRGTGTPGALNHLGVEVVDTAAVHEATARLQEGDLATSVEEAVVCCHARQEKVWVHDPAGTPWEFYTVTDDDPRLIEVGPAAGSAGCCA